MARKLLKTKGVRGAVTVFAVLGLAYGCWSGFLSHPRYSLLRSAIENGDARGVKAALVLGADPSFVPTDWWTSFCDDGLAPLNMAVGQGDTKIVKILLDRGADPNGGDSWTACPLEAAVDDERIDLMQLLIDHGARVNDEPDFSSALWRAAIDRKEQSVRFLLAHGADPNSFFEVQGERVTLLEAVRGHGAGGTVAAALVSAGAKSDESSPPTW